MSWFYVLVLAADSPGDQGEGDTPELYDIRRSRYSGVKETE